MIEIYNEIQHIQNVLEKGLGAKWRQDLTLLVKYWKSYPPHYKKKQVKEMALQKCELYVPHFNSILQKGEVYDLVENVWKNWRYSKKEPEKNSKLREISEIRISQEVLEWFLSLPMEYTIDSEKLAKIKKLRSDLKIGEHPMNYARTRMLFTLYIWTLIQGTYLDNPNYFSFDNVKDKLKKDAKLSSSFKMRSERNLLRDLGFLRITEKESDIVLELQENTEIKAIFETPLTNKNTVIITEKELYNIGAWLDEEFKKRKYYTYTCELCGKEIKEKVNKDNRGRKKKYCSSCAKKVDNDVTLDIKGKKLEHITCEECGKDISVVSKYAPKKFCAECVKKHASKRTKKYRQKLKCLRDHPEK